jgi:anti-sigma factor ChrR (cupin superfamily)
MKRLAMKTMNDKSMPDEAVELMLLDIAADAPAADVAARIKRRALKRVADAPHPAAAAMIDIRRTDGWQPFADKAEMKVLHDDGITMSWMVRMGAGAVLDAHGHEGTEECLVMEGDFWLNGVRLGAGDYQVAFAGTEHFSARSDGGCLLFVRSPSPRLSASAHASTAR